MALQYGMNILASDMRNILEQNDRQQSGVRTWRKLFGNASLGNQAQADALKGSYADAITQAYKSNLAQRNSILGAGLSAGSTSQMLGANQQNIHNAYRQYIQGYTSDASALAENYGKEVSALDTALNERAKNFSNLYSSAYKYLSDRLSKATMSRDLMDKPLYDEDGKETGYEQETLNYLDEYKMDWLRDDQGNLLTWNEISNQMLNPDGTLNARGTEFFDKMFNATPQGYSDEEGNRVESFDEWLSNENSDLRDWAIGQDAFNFTFAGSNLGTAKTHIGTESTDTTGAPHEYITQEDIGTIKNYIITNLSSELNATIKDFDKTAKLYANAAENVVGPTSESYTAQIKDDLEQKRQVRDEAWKKYTDGVEKVKSDYLKELKNTLGTEQYNRFIADNISFETEYEKLVDKIKKSNTFDETLMKDMVMWYDDFVERTRQFARQFAPKKKKTSGY